MSDDALAGFGPFAAGLDRPERIARLLRLHKVLTSTQAKARAAVLAALDDEAALPAALAALEALPPADRRVLAERYGGRTGPDAFWGGGEEPVD